MKEKVGKVWQVGLIADWFLIRAAREGESLTQMKLQKFVYFAHGWHLGVYAEPLISDSIEAWQWGPVIKSLYDRYADYGSHGLPPPDGMQKNVDSRTDALLERIWDVYHRFTANELSAMTHNPGTPWMQMRQNVRSMKVIGLGVIPNSIMEKYYKR